MVTLYGTRQGSSSAMKMERLSEDTMGLGALWWLSSSSVWVRGGSEDDDRAVIVSLSSSSRRGSRLRVDPSRDKAFLGCCTSATDVLHFARTFFLSFPLFSMVTAIFHTTRATTARTTLLHTYKSNTILPLSKDHRERLHPRQNSLFEKRKS